MFINYIDFKNETFSICIDNIFMYLQIYVLKCKLRGKRMCLIAQNKSKTFSLDNIFSEQCSGVSISMQIKEPKNDSCLQRHLPMVLLWVENGREEKTWEPNTCVCFKQEPMEKLLNYFYQDLTWVYFQEHFAKLCLVVSLFHFQKVYAVIPGLRVRPIQGLNTV